MNLREHWKDGGGPMRGTFQEMISQTEAQIAAMYAVPGPVTAPTCANLSPDDEHRYRLWLAGILTDEQIPAYILHAKWVQDDPFAVWREPCHHPEIKT